MTIFQKILEFGIRTTGFVIAGSLVITLVLAWALTQPLLDFSEWLTNNKKGII